MKHESRRNPKGLPAFCALILVACAFLPASAQDPAAPAAPAPCRVARCGILFDWRGRETGDYNERYGSIGSLETRLTDILIGMGYNLVRARNPEGLTLELRPVSTTALCESVSGTDNRSCTAIGDVTVNFIGTEGAADTGVLRAQNRCNGNERMHVDRFSEYLAIMIDLRLNPRVDAVRPSTRC